MDSKQVEGPYFEFSTVSPITNRPQTALGNEQSQHAPFSFNQAVKGLPGTYWRVLRNPGKATFMQEMGHASWKVVWTQITFYAIIAAIFIFLFSLALFFLLRSLILSINPNVSLLDFTDIALATSIIGLFVALLFPIVFFIRVGITHLLARAFGGRGTILAQSYARLLIEMPIGLLSLICLLIPILGWFVITALSWYAAVLLVFAVMAVYRLNGFKATAVVFIPVVVLYIAQSLAVYYLRMMLPIQPH
jgi:hypothetical protein